MGFPWRIHWLSAAASAVAGGVLLLFSFWAWPPAMHQPPIQALIVLGMAGQFVLSTVFVLFLRIIGSCEPIPIVAVHVAALVGYLPLAFVFSGMRYPR